MSAQPVSPSSRPVSAPWPQIPGLRLSLGLIALLTFSLFALGAEHQFISLDDPDYVTLNPWVRDGFSWTNVRWAFTQMHSSNWHPLTWMSHMLDCELFGLDAGKQHLMSAGWHALNAALCLLVMVRLSGRLGPSLLVAGLFALHPQRVESVSWIAERKDLLAGCFFFLTLLAHLHERRWPSARSRWLVALAFSGGLLSKPSVIMLPLLLLWIDGLPLVAQSVGRRAGESWKTLLLEKAPLFALAFTSALVTFFVQDQSGAVKHDLKLGIGVRLGNAISSYVAYLGSAVLPHKLAYFYPHPALVQPDWSPLNAQTLGSLAFLVLLSAIAWRLRKTRPALLFGWGWYIIVLIPMMGIVQVGEQSRADRYTYLSALGLYLMFAFGLPWRRLKPSWRWLGGGALLAAAASACALEIRHWSSSRELYHRASQVTENNYAAALGLANLDNNEGQLEAAAQGYQEVLKLRPEHPQALHSFGLLRQKQQRSREALILYELALEADPSSIQTYLNLGSLHAGAGRLPEAIQAFGEVVSRLPKGSPPRRQAAQNLAMMGRDFQARLGSSPGDSQLQKLLQAVEAALHP